MTESNIIDLLHDAGLDLSITQNGMLGVSPSTNLNDDLRNLIRENRAVLIECVLKADEVSNRVQAGPADQFCSELVRAWFAPGGQKAGAANSSEEHRPEPLEDPATWRELEAAYRMHLGTCQACIAAERGNRLRCGAGIALRLAQSDQQSGGHP